MKLRSPFVLLIGLLVGSLRPGLAQPIYNMSNLTVDDCKGILLDSENGSPAGSYDHNENYTFSICIPNVPEITLVFEEFCTEEPFMGMIFDYMRFYDGPDTLSPQIGGIFSGTMEPPPITATSGCLTVNFISDANVTCTGWRAEWEIEVPPPVPPNLLPISALDCEDNSLRVVFDRDIPCNLINTAAFAITGPLDVGIVSATPVNCSGGSTRTVDLVVAPPFSVSGDYTVTFTMEELDICQELHILRATQNFRVVNCPLFVDIRLDEGPICAGSCTILTARASGGAESGYRYAWSPAAPAARRIEVCPTQSTTYSVTVTDEVGGTAEASISIAPFPRPLIDGGDRSLCQSDSAFALHASIPGGGWTGAGIADGETGWYDPGLVTSPVDSVRYVDPNGCEALALFTVNPLDEGTDDAACPGSAPFTVSGGSPDGGTWSGPNISPDGLFSPPASPGSFVVTYTHPNGCAGSKTINVGDIVLPPIDTLCQSDSSFALAIEPFGGLWTGPGIVDADLGRFDPAEAQAGDNVLHYAINGCEDSLTIFIKAIDAEWDLSACPEEAPFVLPGNWGPPGGQWLGVGLVDSTAGLYDPAILGDGANDTLTYTFDGCADQRIVYIRYTEVDVDRTLRFCTADEDFALNRQTVGAVPDNGDWRGPGALEVEGEWYFRPALAGPGLHRLVYDANTCLDSFTVEVFPSPQISPATFCEREAPQALTADLPGGIWSGAGILDEERGIFGPGVAGAGTHSIFYESPDGCNAREEIEVEAFAVAQLVGLANSYCFRDTVIVLQTTPPGGTLTIDGQVATQFNPQQIGRGEHLVRYSVGTGECRSEVEQTVNIGLPLAIDLPFASDSICFGLNVTLNASGSGGESQNGYIYFWDQGLGFGSTHRVEPTRTTVYTVTMEDGCSEPARASVEVFVHPEIVVAYTTGPKVCHNDSTTATITSPSGDAYAFLWDSDPPLLGNRIIDRPFTYNVTVSNQLTGCEVQEAIELPGFPPLTANFGISPNGRCISTLESEVDLLDFSVGGTQGWWNFGDSSFQERYVLGENPQHDYEGMDPGEYTVRLQISNEGGCTSEHEESLCIEADHRLFAPNAITPNYDGVNDFFQFKGEGISDIQWQVLNRYGQLLYRGEGMEDRWNGELDGLRVLPGVYNLVARYRTRYDDRERVFNGFITVVY